MRQIRSNYGALRKAHVAAIYPATGRIDSPPDAPVASSPPVVLSVISADGIVYRLFRSMC